MGMVDIAKDRKLGSGQGFYKEVCYDLDIWFGKFIQGHWKPLICKQSSGKVCARLGQGGNIFFGQEFFLKICYVILKTSFLIKSEQDLIKEKEIIVWTKFNEICNDL